MTRPELMSATLAETHFGLIRRESQTVRPVKVPPLRRIMAGVMALAMAIAVVTASAMPTRADERSDNLAKALAAIAIIGIIAHEAGKNRDDDRPYRPQPHNPPRPQPHHPPQPHPEPAYKPRVPAACAIEIEGGHRDVTVYPARCLRTAGFTYRLPERCARNIRIYGRPDRIYTEQCLREAGFRIEERRYGRDRYRQFDNGAD